MRRKKKTTIVTVESRERLTIQRLTGSSIRWCEHCQAETSMVTPDEAAALSRSDLRTVFRQIELGSLHFLDSQGAILICSNSLINRERK
jgi:hypothetical protein